MQRYSWILGVLGLCACNGTAIDISPGSAGAAAVSAGGSSGTSAGATDLSCTDDKPLPTWPTPDGCATASNLPLVGTWHGYVEQQAAPWDELTLEIRGASVAGGVCGTLSFGHGPALAPATDPDLGYPDSNSNQRPGGSQVIPVPGFPLTLLAGSTDGTRVRFTVTSQEVLRSWCALQDSYRPNESGDCNCTPNWGGSVIDGGRCELQDPAGGQDLIVSCSRMQMCMYHACACNAAGCDAAPSGAATAFDLRFTGDTAEGSDSSHSGLRAYFNRVP